MPVLEHLSWIDGTVVVAYMLGMLILGTAFARQSSVTEFLLANRGMGWLPVGVSVMATLFSANSFVFYPGEAYRTGLYVSVIVVATVVSAPIVMTWFIPYFVRSGSFTAYEMLERRFDLRVRTLAAVLFVVLRTGWMAAATFSCSLACSVISGTDLYLTIIVLGVVTTLYTSIGGMKAVMWTDVAQFTVFVVAILGAAVVAIGGVPDGWSGTWSTYAAADKLHFFDFRLDLSIRMGTWALLIGQLVETLSAYGADQSLVQRYLSASSVRVCREAFVANVVGVLVVVPGLLILGVALASFYRANPEKLAGAPAEYFARVPGDLEKVPDLVATLAARQAMTPEQWLARVPSDRRRLLAELNSLYADCPERAEKDLFQVNRQDEVMPFFVRRQMPRGLIGLVVAALLAATMSSISGGIHSISTCIMTDLRNRIFRSGRPADPASDLTFARTLVFALGLTATVLACFVNRLGPIFDMTKKLNGAFSGPLLAMFVLAIFSRRTRALPVLLAALLGTGVALYLTYFTKISPLWFCAFGFAVAWTLGLAGSVLTGPPVPEAAEATARGSAGGPRT